MTKLPDELNFTPAVRPSGGTYVANCCGARASCTIGPEEAVEAAARKYVQLICGWPLDRYTFTMHHISGHSLVKQIFAVKFTLKP